MNAKRLITLVLIGVFSLSTLYAQQGRQRLPAAERAQTLTNQMKEKLSLDSTLCQSAHAINLRYELRADSLLQSMEGRDRRAAFEQIQEQRNDKDKEFKKILSKDQYKKYLKLQEEQNAQMRPQGGQRPGGQRPPGQGRPSL